MLSDLSFFLVFLVSLGCPGFRVGPQSRFLLTFRAFLLEP